MLDQVQTDSWICCDAGLVLRVDSSHSPPLKYESVQTTFVPKTHADACLFLLLQSRRELSRVAERNCGSTIGREESVRPCGPSSGLQGNEAARCEPVLDGIDCCNLEWIRCLKARLGTVLVEQSSMSRGLPQGRPESPVIFTMIMELVLRDLIKSWITRKLAWRLDDFVLAAICLCGRCGVGRCIDVCCRSDGDRGDRKTERGLGLTVGAQKTHWTSKLPKDGRQKHHGGWTGCVVGGSLGVCGIKGVVGRECKTCDRTQICSSQQMSGEVETCSEIFMVSPRCVALEHCKTTMWQAFLWSSSVWTTVKAQRDKIASWSARMVANVMVVKKPPWMELDQWWRLWHRTGHRWIEKSNMNVLTAIRERMLSWGWSCCKNGPQRNLCEGLEMPRFFNGGDGDNFTGKKWRKTKWSGPHPQRFKIYRWEDMVAGEVSKFTGNADGLSESVQDNTGWLHLAQNRGSWKQFAKCGKSPVKMVPGASGTHARPA